MRNKDMGFFCTSLGHRRGLGKPRRGQGLYAGSHWRFETVNIMKLSNS